jgi:regulatory protein
VLARLARADRQIEAGESLSESDGARNPHRDRERSPAFFFAHRGLLAPTSAEEHLLRPVATLTDDRHTGETMSQITGIVPVARPAGRFAIQLDGQEVAILSLEAIERLGLAVGRPAAGLEQRIALEAARLHTYDRALNLLAFRGRASSELARALLRKGEEKPHVDWAIARLTEQGLLDDAAFARAFTRAKVVGGKQSRRRVQQDLARKGVERTVTNDAIDTVFDEEAVDQRAIVEEAARKKLRSLAGLEPAVQRRRLYGYLARRGYELDDIREALAVLAPTIAGLDATDSADDDGNGESG